MKDLINYFKESKITLIVTVIALLVAVLGTHEIWTASEYGTGINILMSLFAITPFTALIIGITRDIKNYKND